MYLEAISSVEPTIGRDYGRRLVELTATHARDKLLRLLQSNTIPLRDATEICQRRELWREYAYCLQHGGKVKEAIKLMISKLGLVEEVRLSWDGLGAYSCSGRPSWCRR